MRVPIHVLRTGIGLCMPSTRPFGEGDGLYEVVTLVHRLAVRNGGKAVEKSDAQPPSVGVGGVRVKGLGQPVGCDVEQQAMGHVVHSTTEPFLVNLKRVITEVHAVGNDEVDHGVEVAVKHAAINAEDTEAFFEQLVGRRRRNGWKIRVAHGRFWQGPSLCSTLKRLNQTRCDALKGFVRNLGSALAHAVHLLGSPSVQRGSQMSSSMLRF